MGFMESEFKENFSKRPYREENVEMKDQNGARIYMSERLTPLL